MRYLACFAVFLIATTASFAGGQSQSSSDILTTYPDLRTYESAGQIERLYGTVFGVGVSPEHTAADFVSEHADVFGLTPAELAPGRPADGQLTQPIMYNPDTGTYKFTLVYYTQQRDGLPVYESELRLLVRNEPGYPLVWAGSTLRDLGDYRAAPELTRQPAIGLAHAAATQFEPSLSNFSSAETIVWAGTADELAQPRAAVTFVADNGLTGPEAPQRWRVVADARTGELLHTENLIIFTDLTGTVSGMVTEGSVAEQCADEVPTPLPYVEVMIDGGESVFADVNGEFTIPHDAATEVTVLCDVGGLFFDVNDSAMLSQSVMPPGPVELLHNQVNLQNTRAEVNAYYHANVVRNFALAQNPSYPVIDFQTNFPINVNRTDGYCPGNAWYSGNSINFCLGSGTYPNTAFGSVVHHEYGHHLVNSGGSGQGQYGEGMSDSVALLIADDPVLGVGFTGNCGSGLRNADNDFQYPCNGAIHYCGQLLSGCVWSTRNELLVTHPDDYLEILSNLTINSILLHTGTEITPQITIDFLTLDDNDTDITNGTPHYAEINAGFSAHNMPAPELTLVEFVYPEGRPPLFHPDGSTTLSVTIESHAAQPLPDSAQLHYTTGDEWTAVPMTMVDTDVYQVAAPALSCDADIEYYFTVETTSGIDVADPPYGPLNTYFARSGYGLVFTFADDFENDLGWIVENGPNLTAGEWERGVPAGDGTRGDPLRDYDDSGMCYLTSNLEGDSDVDGGYTWLISPPIDLSEADARVVYALWYTNHVGADPNNERLFVHVSNDDGDTWQLVREHGPVTEHGWNEFDFRVSDHVTLSDAVRVRFEVSDFGNPSIVEAAVDGFRVERTACEPFAPGDMDCNLSVNFDDIDGFVLALVGSAEYETAYPFCDHLNADFNDDNVVNFDDIELFVSALAGTN